MKKQTKLLSVICVTLFLSAISVFNSCQIGLGAAVDVMAPEGTITFPTVDTIIRDSFAVRGTWSDDASLNSITITLKRTDQDISYGPYTATFDHPTEGAGYWKCVIDPVKDGEKVIPDGVYEMTVNIIDVGNHTTPLTKQFSIDNTAPILVLQRPGTTLASDDSEADEYGQHFSLGGQVSDAGKVDIDVNVYKNLDFSDTPELVQLKNVPSTLSLDVAVYKNGEDNDYSKIYGYKSIDDAKAAGAQVALRFCKITSYDDAQRYPIEDGENLSVGASQEASDTRGNSTTTYYLYDDVSGTELLGTYKITEIYNMLNGTYVLDETNRSAADSDSVLSENVKAVKAALEKNKNDSCKFKLNPDNSPKFTVSGKPVFTGDYTLTSDNSAITSDSTVIIDVKTGLDGYTLKKDSLRAYILPCDKNGKLPSGIEDIEKNRIYLSEAGDCKKNGTSYRFSVDLKTGYTSAAAEGAETTIYNTFITGNTYIFGVEGEDFKGNKVCSDGDYSFFFKSSSTGLSLTAQVSLDNTTWVTDDVLYAKKDTTIYITGFVVGDEEVDTEKFKVTFNGDAAGVTLNADKTAQEFEAGKYKQPFTASYTTSDSLESDKTYELYISGGDSNSAIKKVVKYDSVAPEINIDDPAPLAKDYTDTNDATKNNTYLNGSNVSLTVRVSDTDFVSSGKIEFQQQTDSEDATKWVTNEELTRSATSGLANWVISNIDTTKLIDGNVRFVVTASDRSGNIAVKESSVYVVKQSTDKPAAKPADQSVDLANSSTSFGDTTYKKNYRSAGGTLSVYVYDDDGINSIVADSADKDSSGNIVLASDSDEVTSITKSAGTDESGSKLSLGTTTDFTVTLNDKISSKIDAYKITLNVTDIYDNETAYTFYIKINPKAPVIAIETEVGKATSNVISDANITPVNSLKILLKIDSNERPFEIKRVYNDGTHPEISKDVTGVESETSEYEDVINLTSITPALASGKHVLQYTVIDKNSNSVSGTAEVYVDNAAPVVTVDTYPSVSETEGSLGKFTGTAAETTSDSYQSLVSVVQYKIGETGTVRTASKTDNTWNAQVIYKDEAALYSTDTDKWNEGSKKFYVRAVDGTGNASAWEEVSFNFDRSSPVAAITQYSDNAGNAKDIDGSFSYGYSFGLKGTASDSYGLDTGTIKLVQVKKGTAIDGSDDVRTEITSGITISDGKWTVSDLPRKNSDPTAFDAYTGTGATGSEAADGTYEYTISVSDLFGKTSGNSNKVSMTVDHVKPTVTLSAPAALSTAVQGSSYTFKATPADTGSGVNYLYYAITDSATAPASESAYTKIDAASGRDWSLRKTLGTGLTGSDADLYEGEHFIYLYATDAAGNVSDKVSGSIYVDQSAPSVTLDKATTDIVYSTAKTVTLSGTITETNKLASFVIKRGSTTVKTFTIGTGSGNIPETPSKAAWSYTDTITDDNTYTYTFEAADIRGKKSDAVSKTVIFDTVKPAVDTAKFTLPTADETVSEYFTFKGAAASATDTAVSSGIAGIDFIFTSNTTAPAAAATANFSVVPAADGSWSQAVEFASYSVFSTEGDKYLWARARDNAGNTGSWTSSAKFVYDKSKPSITETSFGEDNANTYQTAGITLGGSAADTYGVKSVVMVATNNDTKADTTFNLVSSGSSASVNWSKALTLATGKSGDASTPNTLADGEYTVVTTVTDLAGKTNSVTRTVKIDTTVPSITKTETTNASTEKKTYAGETWYNTKTIKVKVTSADAESGVAAVYYTTKAYNASDKRTTSDWSGLVKQSDGTYLSSVTFTDDGSNTIYLKVVDKAGNVRGEEENYQTMTFNIDSTAPESINVYDEKGSAVEYTLLTSQAGAVDVWVEASDGSGTGIAGIAAGSTYTGAVTAKDSSATVTANQNRYKVSIPQASQITGPYYFTARDNVGNTKSFTPFSFKVDNRAPEIDLQSPKGAAGATTDSGKTTAAINGAVEISTTVSDYLESTSRTADGQISTVDVYYALSTETGAAPADSSTDWIKSETNFISENAKETFTLPSKVFSTPTQLSGKDSNGKLNLVSDTTNITQYIWIKVVAEDTAGHTTSLTRKLYIDRDADRPVIEFNNITLGSSMASGSEVWLSNTTVLSGTVTDDDGDVTDIKISPDNTKWYDASLANGGWSFDIQDFYETNQEVAANGTHTLYFKVTDAEGHEFTSDYGTAGLSSVYLVDGTNKYGISGSKPAVVYVKVDTRSPVVSVNDIKLTSDAAYSEIDNFKIGGTDDAFTVKFSATDENGLSAKPSVTALFSASDGTEVKTLTGTVTGPTDGYYYAAFTADSTIISSKKSGTITIAVTAVDNDKHSTTQRRKASFDYQAPTITFKQPASDSLSGGSVTAYGLVSETSTVYYALSLSGTTVPGTTASDATAVTSWTGHDTDNENAEKTGTISGIKPYYKQIEDAGLSWFIYFDGTSVAGATHDNLLKDFLVESGVTTEAAINNQSFKYEVDSYLWIKAIDTCGNTASAVYKIQIDPQGDRPTASISYPGATDTLLSGQINVYGTAEPKNANIMKYVWVQLVSSNHVTTFGDSTTYTPASDAAYGNTTEASYSITKDDLNYLAAAGYDVYNMKTYRNGGTGAAKWTTSSSLSSWDSTDYTAAASDFGILYETNGSTGWNLKINNKKEFDASSNVDVAICAYAQDAAGHLSQRTVKTVQFDASKPSITDVYLRQYSDTTETASVAYTKDIWVKGKWYLEGTVKDNQNIYSVKLYDENDQNISSVEKTGIGTTVSPVTSYSFKYELDTDSGAGSIIRTIKVADSSDSSTANTTELKISINYDNAPPTIYTAEDDFDTSVKNSNGYYSFGSQAYEPSSESGIDYAAVYFMRNDASGNKRVIDVMMDKGSAGNTVTVASSSAVASGFELTDGLYWKVSEISTVAQSSVTLSAADANAHKGGLIKLNGTVYKISNVSGAVISINGSLDTSTTGVAAIKTAKAKVALANVIDNTIQEFASDTEKQTTTGWGYGYGTPSNDDGDLMIEYLASDGTWSASINSRNIYDGSGLTAHYVVADKAGNISTQDVNGTLTVSNNAPRVAGVTVNTDFNSSGTAGTTITDYNAAHMSVDIKTSSSGTAVYDPDSKNYLGNKITEERLNQAFEVGSSTNGFTIFKGRVEIVPEIIGGNGKIYYSYKDSKALSGTNTTALISEGSTDYTTKTGTINLQVGDLIKASDTANGGQKYTEASPDKLEFTFYDSTNYKNGTKTAEGVDTTAQKTSLTMYFGIDVLSDSVPAAAIEPLYWKGLTDNSIYGTSSSSTLSTIKQNGHIELSDDLPAAFTTGGSGVNDRDDKVSGKIVLKGTAEDTIRITDLFFNIPGLVAGSGSGTENLTTGGKNYLRLAKEVSGTLTGTDSFTASGYKLEVENDYGTEKHSVNWTLSLDTEKFTDKIAKTDVVISVIARNQGPASSDATTVAANKKYQSIDGSTWYEEVGYKDQKVTAAETYQVDVVPYVTELNTTLSASNSDSSVYGRSSSTGAYPVYYYSTKRSSSDSDDSITFKGFNLTGATVTFQGTSNNTATLDSNKKIAIPSGAESGAISVAVNGVTNLNNSNSNDAVGGYTPKTDSTGAVAATYNNYKNYYNRQPNNINNDLLTDDLSVFIWDLNAKAATVGGAMTRPVMHVNPKNGKLGLAFVNVNKYYMPNGNNNSYDYFAVAWNDFNSVGFTYDPSGIAFGVEMGTDSNNQKYVSKFRLLSSMWGYSFNGNRTETASGNASDYLRYNALRLEGMNFQTDRFDNHPKMVATTGSNSTDSNPTTNLYLMYYDPINNELIMRAGEIDHNGIESVTQDNADPNTTNIWGDFKDITGGNNGSGTSGCCYSNYPDYDVKHIVASSVSTYSLAVIPKGTNSSTSDTIVATWVNANTGTLYYGYLTNAITNNRSVTTQTVNTNWKVYTLLNGTSNGYSAITTDAAGGVHIAASSTDSDGSLVYFKFPAYNTLGDTVGAAGYTNATVSATATASAAEAAKYSCVVDSYGVSGAYLTIDTAKVGTSYIPYISYYSSSTNKPKYAYLADTATSGVINSSTYTPKAGSDSENMYLKAWESFYIPTFSTISVDDSIQIGIYKTSAGVALAIPNQGSTNPTDTTSGTMIGGNGTTNPIIGYGTTYGTGFFETAQLK